MASAYFLEQITRLTDAETDQQHLDIIMFSRPNVPDRTAYVLDNTKPSPAPFMIDTAQTLESLGADYICAPCVTSHYIFGEIQSAVNVPLINMIDETVAALKEKGCRKAGIMATTGTIRSGLFQAALKKAGIDFTVPGEERQSVIMDIIYNEVKAGNPVDMERFFGAADGFFSDGCDCVILGCTELSVINNGQLDERFIDALTALAEKCIKLCKDSVN